MSIDLVKAVHYCHGACDEPRGGGPANFLVKWARVHEGRRLTKSEAQRELRRAFSLPTAAELKIELKRKEVQLFAWDMPRELAGWAKLIERAIDDVNAYCADYPKERNDDEIWDMLALLQRERWWADYAFAVCVRSTRKLRVETFAIWQECRRRAWWTQEIELHAQTLFDMHERERLLRRQYEENLPCPESPSTTTMRPSRQPVPR